MPYPRGPAHGQRSSGGRRVRDDAGPAGPRPSCRACSRPGHPGTLSSPWHHLHPMGPRDPCVLPSSQQPRIHLTWWGIDPLVADNGQRLPTGRSETWLDYPETPIPLRSPVLSDSPISAPPSGSRAAPIPLSARAPGGQDTPRQLAHVRRWTNRWKRRVTLAARQGERITLLDHGPGEGTDMRGR